MFVVLDKVLTTWEGLYKSEYSPKERRNKQNDDQEVTRFFVDSSKVFVQTLPLNMRKCRLQTCCSANGQLLKPDKHHRIRIGS
jgi:hypothetical protein